MLPAIIHIILYWLFLIVVVCGLGLLSVRWFEVKEDLIFSSFWSGYCTIIIILQIWHLVFPVNVFSFIILSIIGILSILFTIWHHAWNFQSIIGRLSIDRIFILLISLLVLTFTASCATSPIMNGDTGRYHLPSILWDSSFPITPGLGNLYSQLAFNSSYFLYAAFLYKGYWLPKSYHLANGPLFLMVFLQIFVNMKNNIFMKNAMKIDHIIGVIFLIPISFLCLQSCSIPSPDIPLFILGFIAITYFSKIINPEDQKDIIIDCFLLIMICAVAITIKIAFLFMGLPLMLIAFSKVILSKPYTKGMFHMKNLIIIMSILTAVTVVPWLIRNIILSGYVIYPSPLLSFNVDWKMPYSQVLGEQLWIKSWARMPGLPPEQVLDSWKWVFPWAKRIISENNSLILIIWPILIGICGLFIFYKRCKHDRYDGDKKLITNQCIK